MIKAHPPFAAALWFGTLSAAASTASAHASVLTRPLVVVDQAGARLALQAAEAKAASLKAPSSIAVVDPSGILVAFESMDGVRAGSSELAIGKARTAALLQRPTTEVEDNINQGRTAFVTAHLMALRGGVPLRVGDLVVGAIGVAGRNKDDDVAVATDAAKQFTNAATQAGTGSSAD